MFLCGPRGRADERKAASSQGAPRRALEGAVLTTCKAQNRWTAARTKRDTVQTQDLVRFLRTFLKVKPNTQAKYPNLNSFRARQLSSLQISNHREKSKMLN